MGTSIDKEKSNQSVSSVPSTASFRRFAFVKEGKVGLRMHGWPFLTWCSCTYA